MGTLQLSAIENIRNRYSGSFKIIKAASDNGKFRINLKSFEIRELNETCDAIKMIGSNTNALSSGPIPLPLKKKDSREHFEIRTHSRYFEIKHWSSDTVDQLMAYEVP